VKHFDPSTPVLVLNCKLGGLAIFRSLGMQGVECWGIDDREDCPGFLSKYSRGCRVVAAFEEDRPEAYLATVLAVAARIGRRAILIPTSDELVLWTARNASVLGKHFLFPRQDIETIDLLTGKAAMTRIAAEHGVPVPLNHLPASERDLLEVIERFQFPVMLKPSLGSGQNTLPGQTMVLVHDRDELLREYREREDPDRPNMMIQEYIPGEDDDIWIFDGYFDEQSVCRAAFTGRKLRQFPVHRGCASMGEQCPADEVAAVMTRFLSGVGYRGIVDAGLRYDRRDGKYKLLDVNPRIGQAFRLFLAADGTDLAQCLYRDMTGQLVGNLPQRPFGRWFIEDYDLISFFDYRREGSLTVGEWVRSFSGATESAWWCSRDLRPFAHLCGSLVRRVTGAAGRRIRGQRPEEADESTAATTATDATD
jgi:predicted ATP-grasp superfamily ATP-dependent carboligase